MKSTKATVKVQIKVKFVYHGLLADREDADYVDSKLNLCRSIYDMNLKSA